MVLEIHNPDLIGTPHRNLPKAPSSVQHNAPEASMDPVAILPMNIGILAGNRRADNVLYSEGW
jgi:hypothetical protein